MLVRLTAALALVALAPAAAVEAAIVENAKLKAGQTRQSIRAGLAAEDLRYRAMFSHDPRLQATTRAGADYPRIKILMNHLTDPATLDLALAGLKTPKDPFKGDCL